MQTIISRGKRYEIPENIDELSPAQYERLLIIYLACIDGYMDERQARRRLLSFFIGMEDYAILLPEYKEELDSALPLLDPFFDSHGLPAISTVRNLLPEYKGYVGPKDSLASFPFGKFIEALTVLYELSAAEEDEAISAGLDHVARLFYSIPEDREVPLLLRLHAPRLLEAVWRMIREQPVMINGALIDFGIIFRSSGGASGPDDHTGWTGILFEVAEKGLFGSVEKVEQTDMWAVLLYLYKCKFEYLHQKIE